MRTVKIEKAEKLGLCSGVRRAIKLLKGAADKYGEIETLGPLAHNSLLVRALADVGVRQVDRLDRVRGRLLAITTHGASPTVLAEIASRRIRIIDTTCPTVRKAQSAAKELAEANLDVVIFGEAEHSEVKGLLGWAGERGLATLDVKQVLYSGKSLSRLGVISQTTQTGSALANFIGELIAMIGPGLGEVRVINTLCRVTQGQQEAAVRLARKTQLMIVVGGCCSANARHLVEICTPLVETHLVETADEVEVSWLTNRSHIGVTAGASTPDEAVEELINRLNSL